MPRAANLSVLLEAETGEFRKGMRRAGVDIERFGEKSIKEFRDWANGTDKQTLRAQRSIERFRRRAAREFSQLGRSVASAVGILGGAFGALAVTQARYAQEIQRTAVGTGQTVAAVQAYGSALVSLGRDQDEVNDLFIDFADRLQEVRDGTSSFVEDFALLGLTAEDFAGLNLEQGIQRFSAAVRNSTDQTKALAAAARIFPQLQGIIGQLGPTVDDLSARLQRTGGLLRGGAADYEAVGRTFTVLSQTLRTQFLAGLSAATGGTEEFDTTIRDLGQVVRRTTEAIVSGIQFLVEYRDVIANVALAVGALVVAVKTVGALTVLVNGARALAGALSPLTLKIALVVGALVGIAAVARIIQSQWQTVLSFFSNFADALRLRFQQVRAFIALSFVEAFRVALVHLNRFLDQIGSALNFLLKTANLIAVFTNRAVIPISEIDLTIDTTFAEEAIEGLEMSVAHFRTEAQAATAAAVVDIVEGAIAGVQVVGDDISNILAAVRDGVIGLFRSDGGEGDLANLNERAATSYTALSQATEGQVVNNIELWKALNTVGAAYKDLEGTELERARYVVEQSRLEEQLRQADESVRVAFNRVTRGLIELPEALEGIAGADDQALLVQFVEQLRELGGDPALFEPAAEVTSFAFVESMRGALQSAVSSGDFSAVGEAMFQNLRNTLASGFVDRFANYLNEALSQLLSGGGFGGFGLGNLFGGSFQQGGIVPGRRGDAVLIRAHAGERVVPEGQGLATFNLGTTIVGNVDQETRRNVVLMTRQQEAAAFQVARENGVF